MRVGVWAFWGALAGLVVFQSLYVLALAQPPHGLVLALLAVFDAALASAFWWAAHQENRRTAHRFARVQDSLTAVLDLAQKQQRHWLSTVEKVSLDPQEQTAIAGLQRLLAAREEIAAGVPADRERGVEGIIDVIQTMLLLNHSLMTDFDEVLSFYRLMYDSLRSERQKSRLHHFRLGSSVEFLGQMGSETNRYSERLVLDVLDSFQEITRFSQGIGTDVRGQIRQLMDPDNHEGLNAVNQESAAIQAALDEFFRDLGLIHQASEKSIQENLVQMQRIQTIAQGIAEFSESIRMISLNLNIEAARGHQGLGSGKAVQVLASKLSEFAVRAQEMAGQQQDVIGTASGVLAQAGQAQRKQLSSLMSAVSPIKSRLDPFARIVGLTFSRFEAVEAVMEKLSSAIEGKLQAVIGKFQFQDLVRQEQEHILAIFSDIYRRTEEGLGGVLSEEQKKAAWNELLETFERLASTENERNVLRAYREKHPGPKSDTGPEISAGTVELF